MASDKRWQVIWRLAVPERVRTFAWQIIHGRLATKVHCSKWAGDSTSCLHCAGVPESIIHVLRDCTRAVSVWRRIVPTNMRPNFFGYEFEAWTLYNALSDAGTKWCALWATTCYFLWSWRNKEVHDDNYTRPYDPVAHIQTYLQQYASSQTKFSPAQLTPKVMIDVAWQPAGDGWLTLNTDGAARSNGSSSGCGGVLRNGQGVWLGGFSRRTGDASPYVAELWGVWEGLRLAWSMGFTNIELQVDSKAVVSAISNTLGDSFDERGLIRRIRHLLDNDWQIRVSHVYREANKVADGLAALGCELVDDVVFYYQPPSSVLQYVHDDCNGVSTPRLVAV